jgi:multiple sugar transport system substrate-binding protein
MGVPVNGNVEVLYFRKDLYEQHGLKVPETWDQVLANATKLNDGLARVRFVHRDDRESALADFANYLFSFGGDIFANASAADFTVGVQQSCRAARARVLPEASARRAAIRPRVPSARADDPADGDGQGGADRSASSAHGPSSRDPAKSAVVGKFDTALIPRAEGGRNASRAGHWIGAIARNVPRERQVAALQFLNWFQTLDHQLAYTRYGAVPVRTDLGATRARARSEVSASSRPSRTTRRCADVRGRAPRSAQMRRSSRLR